MALKEGICLVSGRSKRSICVSLLEADHLQMKWACPSLATPFAVVCLVLNRSMRGMQQSPAEQEMTLPCVVREDFSGWGADNMQTRRINMA